MRAFVQAHELSGVVTLVADREGIIHLSAIGQRDIERDLPMETDTVFWVASLTKLVTAVAVMMLQEDGKLSIDDPASKYVPEFSSLKTPSGRAAKPTLRQMLTHTSGLDEAPREKMLKAHSLAELIPDYLNEPMHFEPGTRWEYCQSGINTLGRIIEIASGRSYADFLRDRIFDPLGMKDATFYPTAEQIGRLAVSYDFKDGKLAATPIRLLGAISDPTRFAAANSGLFCTGEEFSRFCRMLLNGGTLEGRGYLKAQSIKEMTRGQSGDLKDVGFIPGSCWGLGFGIVREAIGVTATLSPGTFGHGGAYGTQAWIDPVKKRIYILLIQRADLPNSDGSEFRKVFQQAAAEAMDSATSGASWGK